MDKSGWGKYHAHEEVIELLQLYLETAKAAPFGAAAVVMVGNNDKQVIGAADFAGEISLNKHLMDQLEVAKAMVSEQVDACRLPPQDDSLDASYAVYNMADGPLGWDFVVWLVDAEMKRVAAGAPFPLKVAFWIGKDAAQRINRDKRKMWLEKVFRPALKLIGAVEDERALHGSRDPICVSRDIVKAAKSGQRVPIFKGIDKADIGYPYVTITLREAEHWAERNSRVEEWIGFAKYLQAHGEKVIFIRDTAKADEPIPGFACIPMASKDLLWRMSVYEGAKANLFKSNGPVTLAVYSDRPWLQFVETTDELSTYRPNRPEFWETAMGVKPPEQYPWSAPNQRLVWADDTYENLVAAWHEYIEPAAKAA